MRDDKGKIIKGYGGADSQRLRMRSSICQVSVCHFVICDLLFGICHRAVSPPWISRFDDDAHRLLVEPFEAASALQVFQMAAHGAFFQKLDRKSTRLNSSHQ